MSLLFRVAARVLFLLCGLIFLYAAAFLYEDEERRIQNKLEDWWIALADQRNRALFKHTAFMRSVARTASAGFERIFGKKLFSFRAVGVSICYSIATACFFRNLLRLTAIANGDLDRRHVLLAMAGLGLSLVFVAIGSLPACVRRPVSLPLWFVLVISTAATLPILNGGLTGWDSFSELRMGDFGEDTWWNQVPQLEDYVDTLFALILGWACDAFFITVNRWLLRWTSEMQNFFVIAATVFANLVFAPLLVLIPLVIAWAAEHTPGEPLFFNLGFSNILDVLAAYVFAVLAALMLIHRMLWPLLNRPIYALQDLGIARRRVLFSTIGIASLSASGLNLPDGLRKIIGLLSRTG